MSFVRFAKSDDIPPGANKSVRIGLRRIVVFNIAGSLFAIEDACSHMKAPLSQGRLKGKEITCTWHGWSYDLATGRRLGSEAGCVRTFPLKVEAGSIFVDPTVVEQVGDGEDEAAEYPDGFPPPA